MEIIPALKGAIERSRIRPEQVVVIAFHDEVIAQVKKAMPAVVNIYTSKEMRRGPLADDPLMRRYFPELA